MAKPSECILKSRNIFGNPQICRHHDGIALAASDRCFAEQFRGYCVLLFQHGAQGRYLANDISHDMNGHLEHVLNNTKQAPWFIELESVRDRCTSCEPGLPLLKI